MDIFSYESARRIGDQNVLRKVDALIDWSAISVLLKNRLKRSGLEPQGYRERPLHNRRFTPLLGFGMFALVNLRRFYGPIFA